MTKVSFSQVAWTATEMRLFVMALRENGLTTRDFEGKAMLRMFAYRGAVKAGVFTDEIKEKAS